MSPHAAPHSGGRRNLLALTGASFIGFSGFTLAMPFLPLYIRALGVSDVGEIALWTGVTLGVTPALSAMLSPFWGRLADRFGRKIMLVRALASCAVVMAIMAFVTSPWHVLALRAFLGLFTGYGGLAIAMAADSVPRPQMASAIGHVQTAQRLGPALGPAAGGLLAGWVGLRPAFLAAAGFYVIGLLLVVMLYVERGSETPTVSGEAAGAVGYRTLLRLENFWLLLLAAFGVQFVDRSVGPILALYAEHVGVSSARVAMVAGMLFSLTALAAASGHYACGALLKRHPAPRVITGACLASAIGAVLFVLAPNPWIMVPAGTFFGAGSGTAVTAIYSVAGSVIPRSAQGAGFGLLTSASLVGIATSPVVAGILGARTLRGVFVLDIAILILLALIVRRTMAISVPER